MDYLGDMLTCDIEPNLQLHTIVRSCQRHSADSETKYDVLVLCVFLEYHKQQCFAIWKKKYFQVAAWLSVLVQDGIRNKLALVSWNDCAPVALCSAHKAQGWFLFCPCKLFDYGKIKWYRNCFFTDLICWFYSRLIPKPSKWKYIGLGVFWLVCL